MAIALRQSVAFAAVASSFGAAPSAGDLLVAATLTTSPTLAITGDAGWVKVGEVVYEGPSYAALWAKRAGAGQTAGPLGVSVGAGGWNIALAEFSGGPFMPAAASAVQLSNQARGFENPLLFPVTLAPPATAQALLVGFPQDANTPAAITADAPATLIAAAAGNGKGGPFMYQVLAPATGAAVTLQGRYNGASNGGATRSASLGFVWLPVSSPAFPRAYW